DRKSDAELGGEPVDLLRVGQAVRGGPDDHDAVRGAAPRQVDEQRHLVPAGKTPGGPEVDDDEGAGELREIVRPAVPIDEAPRLVPGRCGGRCRGAHAPGKGRYGKKGRETRHAAGYFGCGTILRYGFGAFQPPGKRCRASSSLTAETMITSCPCFQF